MKICVFGGTFDPLHLGHESIINKLLLEFDKVIIMPSKQSPGKNNFPLANDLEANPKCVEGGVGITNASMSGLLIMSSAFEVTSIEG